MKRLFTAVALGFLSATSSLAQEYVIGGGDSLQINVWKNPELSQNVIVRPDGQITLPLIRDVRAEGLSAMELGKVLAERLSAFVNTPNVTVTVSNPTSFKVYTQGAIANGRHSLAAPITAHQLLSLVGGGTAEADLSRAYVLRGERRIPVDLASAANEQAATTADPLLVAGDILVVPVKEVRLGRILILGEVAQPHAKTYSEGMTFLDAFLGAGGGTPAADLKNARVVRLQEGGETEEITVDVEELVKQGDLNKNIVLAPGDVLIVPFKAPAHRILVVGEVRSPRAIAFREGLTVLDAYVESGGGTDYAELDSVKVVRKAPDGSKQELVVDLERILKKADVSRNIPLSPGDIVMVPR